MKSFETHKLSLLVDEYRALSPQAKQWVKDRHRNKKPIEIDECKVCYNEGFTEHAFGEDDYEKEICEQCDSLEVKTAINIQDCIHNLFQYMAIRLRRH